MTDPEHDSPGRLGVGFRFRAGEDDLEELSLPDAENEAQYEGFQKILQLPRKLLHKEHSLSDSEDTSESSKLSEWWKDAEESRVTKSDSLLSITDPEETGLRKRVTTVNVVTDIKISRGRVDPNAPVSADVEAAEEAGEGSTPPTTPIDSSEATVTESPPSSISLRAAPTISIYDPAMKSALGFLVTWCVPMAAVASLPSSSFWNGVVYGVCLLGLSQALWNLVWTVLTPSAAEVQKGPFQIPDYSALPPLKTLVTPIQKRGCFNVYNKPYNPDTYSVSQTRPACLELNGSLLKLIKVKTKLGKRAHFRQPDFEVDPSREVVYDLTKCSVMLLPEGLTRKRLFSKKYPITVLLGEGAIVKVSKPGDEPYHAGWETQTPANESDDNREESTGNDVVIPITPALYLFARCDRDKEDWYRRLLAASPLLEETIRPPSGLETVDTLSEKSDDNAEEREKEEEISSFDEYLLCMSKFVEMPHKVMYSNLSKGEAEMEMEVDSIETQWFNAVVNRVLFDVFRSPYWIQKIQEKLQKKLSSIKLPYYVEEMQIVELNLGRSGPIVHRISQPILDERGIWFDMELTHQASLKVTIQTKLNLRKLHTGKDEEDLDTSTTEKAKSPLYDSEAEDSAESSSGEDSRPTTPLPSNEPETPVKKKKTPGGFLRIVENVAQSRAFRHVAQSKVVQKVIAGVSQTKLRLQVEVHGIVGTVAVNIPPPPSDRVWYGFRGMPKIWLSATPLVGEFNVAISQIKTWIEKKLIQEFQLTLVLPNMGYIIYPFGTEIQRANMLNDSSRSPSNEDIRSLLDFEYYPDLKSLLEAGIDPEANLNSDETPGPSQEKTAGEKENADSLRNRKKSHGKGSYDLLKFSDDGGYLVMYNRKDSREVDRLIGENNNQFQD